MKKIICFFTMFLIVLMMSQISFATTTEDVLKDAKLKEVSKGITEGWNDDRGVGGVLNTIIGLLQVAGTGISLIMVTVLGIKYMLAGVGDKAEIKKQATPIVIGCILLFGAVNIMAIVEKVGQKINAK